MHATDLTRIPIVGFPQQAVTTSRGVSARERFEFIRECLNINPRFSMSTEFEASSTLGKKLHSFYMIDQAFILSAVKNRPEEGAQQIPENINLLDSILKTIGMNKKFSIRDYNYIGYQWARILSGELPELDDFLAYCHGCIKFRCSIIDRYSRMKDIICKIKGNIELKWLDRRLENKRTERNNNYLKNVVSFAFPHISKTGLIKTSLINECNVFTDRMGNFHSLDFLSVGTDENIRFDAHEGNAIKCWHHDLRHMVYANRITFDTVPSEEYKKSFANIFNFKKAANRKIKSKSDKYAFTFAFFELFHEQVGFYKYVDIDSVDNKIKQMFPAIKNFLLRAIYDLTCSSLEGSSQWISRCEQLHAIPQSKAETYVDNASLCKEDKEKIHAMLTGGMPNFLEELRVELFQKDLNIPTVIDDELESNTNNELLKELIERGNNLEIWKSLMNDGKVEIIYTLKKLLCGLKLAAQLTEFFVR